MGRYVHNKHALPGYMDEVPYQECATCGNIESLKLDYDKMSAECIFCGYTVYV
jgi:hypothetical protein